MPEFTVERDGVTLAGEEAGEGVPVVLLHGLTATRRYVVMGSRSLERSGHRVVAYDARGHGHSSPAPDPSAYTYPRAGRRPARRARRPRDRARACCAGASMGAHTIVRLALDHGDRVAGIVLATPAYTPDGEHADLERWDALSEGLRTGGVEGFVEAYGDPGVPERWRATVDRVLHQRLAAHDHPDAVADALRAVPRSAAFEDWEELHELDAPRRSWCRAATRPTRATRTPSGERYAAEIPGAELRSEEPGESPLAWQGGQLSKVIAELAERAGAGA